MHFAIQSFEELRKYLEGVGSVGIIGYPGAGKTTLAEELALDMPVVYPVKIIHTDDFLLSHDHEIRPQAILDHIQAFLPPIGVPIVEGNEVTRLPKRGWQPDLLICVTGSERADKATAGLRGRVDKFLAEFPGDVFFIAPRELEKKNSLKEPQPSTTA